MKKRSLVLLMVGGLILALALAVSACGGGGSDDAIVGVWTDEEGLVEYEFKSDGSLVVTFMGQEDQTTYSTEGGLLMFPDPDTGEQSEIQYRVEGDKLIMTVDGEEGILVRKQ